MTRADSAARSTRYWSPLASVLWGGLGFGIIYASQFGAQIGLVYWELRKPTAPDVEYILEYVSKSGDMLTIASFATLPMVLGLVFFAVRLRGYLTVREYLGLYRINWGSFRLWTIVFVAYVALSYAIGNQLGRWEPQPFLLVASMTSSNVLLLWLAVSIALPLAEEVLYRGFVLPGLLESRLAPAVSVALLALLWSLTHFQYDLYGTIHIFVLGLFLGWSRVQSGSILPALAMHIATNIVAMTVVTNQL